MARNVEIKTVIDDYKSFYSRAKNICDKSETFNQIDTYFNCRKGRLKLREIPGKTAEIISYNRTNTSSPKLSKYYRYPIKDPKHIAKILSETLGIKGIIEKQRTVFLVGQTRIHLDKVNRLGLFAELEVVLAPNQTEKNGRDIAKVLMKKLGIKEVSLIDCSYIDLIKNKLSVA